MITQEQMDSLWSDRGNDCLCGSHVYKGMDDELYCYRCDSYYVQQMGKYAAGNQKIDDSDRQREELDPVVLEGILKALGGK